MPPPHPPLFSTGKWRKCIPSHVQLALWSPGRLNPAWLLFCHYFVPTLSAPPLTSWASPGPAGADSDLIMSLPPSVPVPASLSLRLSSTGPHGFTTRHLGEQLSPASEDLACLFRSKGIEKYIFRFQIFLKFSNFCLSLTSDGISVSENMLCFNRTESCFAAGCWCVLRSPLCSEETLPAAAVASTP